MGYQIFCPAQERPTPPCGGQSVLSGPCVPASPLIRARVWAVFGMDPEALTFEGLHAACCLGRLLVGLCHRLTRCPALASGIEAHLATHDDIASEVMENISWEPSEALEHLGSMQNQLESALIRMEKGRKALDSRVTSLGGITLAEEYASSGHVEKLGVFRQGPQVANPAHKGFLHVFFLLFSYRKMSNMMNQCERATGFRG